MAASIAPIPLPPSHRLQIENPLLRRGAKLVAAYRSALRPRLLVLIGLAALMGLYNRAAAEPLPLVYEGCVLGGFLSYKLALLVKLFDDLTPKVAIARAVWSRLWALGRWQTTPAVAPTCVMGAEHNMFLGVDPATQPSHTLPTLSHYTPPHTHYQNPSAATRL